MADQNNKLGAPVPESIIAKIREYGDFCAGGRHGSVAKLSGIVLALRRHYRAAPAAPAVDALTQKQVADILLQSGLITRLVYSALHSGDLLEASLEYLTHFANIARSSTAPADPEQAKLDSLAQAGLAAALESHARQPAVATAEIRAVLAKYDLENIADRLIADLAALPVARQPQAAPEATSEPGGNTQPIDGYQHDSYSAEHIANVLGIAPPAEGEATSEQMGGAQVAKHPIDAAVDSFAEQMKWGMISSSAEGHDGWYDPARCTVEKLAADLVRAFTGKGNPLTIANYAMMLHSRNGTGMDVSEALGVWFNRERNTPLDPSIGEKVAAAATGAQVAKAEPELTVWCGPMPESNGKSNFTAVLMRKGATMLDGFVDGHTIARSEYPDRVRYEADRVRYLIGELTERPFILDYDADKHSGYAAPTTESAAAPADLTAYRQAGFDGKEICPTTRGNALAAYSEGIKARAAEGEATERKPLTDAAPKCNNCKDMGYRTEANGEQLACDLCTVDVDDIRTLVESGIKEVLDGADIYMASTCAASKINALFASLAAPEAPERKPMTEDELTPLLREAGFDITGIIRKVEQHHGITGGDK